MGRWSKCKLNSEQGDNESQLSTAEPESPRSEVDSVWSPRSHSSVATAPSSLHSFDTAEIGATIATAPLHSFDTAELGATIATATSSLHSFDTVELGATIATAPCSLHSFDTPSGEMLLTDDDVRYQVFCFRRALHELNCAARISFEKYISWFGLFENGMESAIQPFGGFGVDIFGDARGRAGLFNYIVFKFIAQSNRSWRSLMWYFDHPQAFHCGWFAMPPVFSKAAAMTPLDPTEPLHTYPAIFLKAPDSGIVYRMICLGEAIGEWCPWNVHETRVLWLRLVIR